MIVEFSVKNFRSIKDLQTISFVSTGLKSSEKYSYIDEKNIVPKNELNIFKTIGIYGSNASGKSNIIKAFDYFIRAITREPSPTSRMKELCDPFLYQNKYSKTESFFQIVLIVEDIKYRYGFTIKKNEEILSSDDTVSSNEIITNEWLYGKKEKNNGVLFTRSGFDIKNYLKNDQKIPPLAFPHSLFITQVAAFDKEGECQKIRNYLRGMTTSNFNNDHAKYRWMSIDILDDESVRKNKENFLNLLASFNLKYDDVVIQKDNESDLKPIFPQEKITLSKKYINEDKTVSDISLNLGLNESAGTQKLFDLAGLLLRAFNLPKSGLIILDEIDSNFHPSLLIRLVELFNNPEINKSNSQLLFTSHDTNLMSPSIMRRDQFYFTEKNEDNSTRLYSLSDLKGIRNDADFAKQYLAGYYGALPILENFL